MALNKVIQGKDGVGRVTVKDDGETITLVVEVNRHDRTRIRRDGYLLGIIATLLYWAHYEER